MKIIKEEVRIFFTALMFYTRIPCPSWVDHSANYINKASRYFPLIGYVVGLISFLGFYAFHLLFSVEISILASIIIGVLATGAFHEDGFADVCDGFGGGWTKSKILEIMKDSRVGAYGVVGLIFLFAAKFILLKEIVLSASSDIMIALIFIFYHSFARFTTITIVFTENYAREDQESKAKPIAQSHTWKEIVGASLFAFIPFFTMFLWSWKIVFLLIPLFLIRFFSIRYFNKWIEGYTGDCLGAVEQIAEITILLSFVAIWKFI